MSSPELDAAREGFLCALVAGDPRTAEHVALEAVAEGLSVTDLYVDVIAPALTTIGERWAGGAMTVADEHLATGIASGVMTLVGRTARRAPARSRERVLLAAVGSEGHVVGLRMIADLAEGAGFDVRYLGAALPVDTLAGVVGKHKPAIVGLSVTMPESTAQLRAALDQVFLAHAPRAVLVGGGGVTPHLHRDPRVHYARDAREALAIIEDLADPVG